MAGSGGPPQNFGQPPLPMQFRPVSTQQVQQFYQPPSQQYRSVGQTIPLASAGHASVQDQVQISSQMPANNLGHVNGQITPTSYGSAHILNAPPQFPSVPPLQNPAAVHNYTSGVLPSTASVGLPGLHSQASVSTGMKVQGNLAEPSASDWQEHIAADQKKYYFNKRTKQSSWEKPWELMTPIERADASTDWKEVITPEGKKYYYNKTTRQSKWNIPEELKIARELAEKQMNLQSVVDAPPSSAVVSSSAVPSVDTASAATNVPADMMASAAVTSSQVEEVNSSVVSNSITNSVELSVPDESSHGGGHDSFQTKSTLSTVKSSEFPLVGNNGGVKNHHDSSSVANEHALAVSADDKETERSLKVTNVDPQDDKLNEEEPRTYATKTDAKNAFKSLLESANVESDWTWDQAMRVIGNDKRFAALKSLGEKKQAFNEYLGQRKKQEAEERRIKQKKAREDFVKMLEECKELTSSIRWSKAMSMFEVDERYSAVERARDREDLFENYLIELQKKERARAAEEHRRNILEYRSFLESCDFIKANTQWRKVQDRLEDDDRCHLLEKIDRLEVFQEYMIDLAKEEEEQKRIQKEKVKRQERKNRDEFRTMLEGHISAGIINAKTSWREYCSQIKDSPCYLAVALNTSGSTPKDLFEGFAEELEKQYSDDKSEVKEAIKSGKISLSSLSTLENFKEAISEDVSLNKISDNNIKLIFDELLERYREKEEKEAKRRQRIFDDFTEMLYSRKGISASSTWDDCKVIIEDTQEYRDIGDELSARVLFEEYVAILKEKLKEKERIREEEKAKKEKEREDKDKKKEEKEKEKKEKERERDKEKNKERSWRDEPDSEHAEIESQVPKERKRDKDKDKKHKRRHHDTADDVSSEKDEKEEPKKSRRHGSERKKSRKYGYDSDSDDDNRHKRHKRDRDGSRGDALFEELEDGELGEDGEIH